MTAAILSAISLFVGGGLGVWFGKRGATGMQTDVTALKADVHALKAKVGA